jgi:hypothetical protein
MDDALREFIRRRARNRCEYCLIPQEATAFFTFHAEHRVELREEWYWDA